MRRTLYQGQSLRDLLNMPAGNQLIVDKSTTRILKSGEHHRNMGLDTIDNYLDGTKKWGSNVFTIIFFQMGLPTTLCLKWVTNMTRWCEECFKIVWKSNMRWCTKTWKFSNIWTSIEVLLYTSDKSIGLLLHNADGFLAVGSIYDERLSKSDLRW